MTSNITYSSINENFPVAGEDNDTQTFRDNFDSIKKGLKTAKEELTDLQTNVVRKDSTNDLAYNVITKAVMQNNRDQVFPNTNGVSNIEGAATTAIDYLNAPYQIYQFGYSVGSTDPLEITLENLPGDPDLTVQPTPLGVGRMYLELYSNGDPTVVKFTVSGSTYFKRNSSWPKIIPLNDAVTVSGSGTYDFYNTTPTHSIAYQSSGITGSTSFVLSTDGYSHGDLIVGAGIPANTYVGSSSSGTTINLVDSENNPVELTAHASGTYKFFTPAISGATATTVSGAYALTITDLTTDVTALVNTQFVIGPGIAPVADPSGVNGTAISNYSYSFPMLLLTSSSTTPSTSEPVIVETWRRNDKMIFVAYRGIYS